MYGCHAYPKKTPNTRGGDYQTPPSYLGLRDSGWKSGVLHSDTHLHIIALCMRKYVVPHIVNWVVRSGVGYQVVNTYIIHRCHEAD